MRLLFVQVGDEVGISTTSYNTWETEKHSITAVSADGRILTLNRPLTHTHIGQFIVCFCAGICDICVRVNIHVATCQLTCLVKHVVIKVLGVSG